MAAACFYWSTRTAQNIGARRIASAASSDCLRLASTRKKAANTFEAIAREWHRN
jgi:hypothetical protein